MFPLYDTVKHVITRITMTRYQLCKNSFNEMICCRDQEEIKTSMLRNKHNVKATSYDFDKIVRTLLNEHNLDLMDKQT